MRKIKYILRGDIVKRFLVLLCTFVLCLSFAGCGGPDVREIDNEKGEIIFKIRETAAKGDYFASKLELLDLNDNVIYAYEATEGTLLAYSNTNYSANRFPFSLSERTLEHYGFHVNRNFYTTISRVDKETKNPVFEEILTSDPLLKVIERHYYSESSDKGVVYKTDKIELFLPDGRLFISCELSPENAGNGAAMLGGIVVGIDENYEELDYYLCQEYVDGFLYKTYYFDLFTGEPIDAPSTTD